MSCCEDNKRTARLWFVLIEAHRIEDLCAMTAPTWLMRGGPPGLPPGAAGVRALFGSIGPINQKWTIEDVIAEGDKVVVRATNTCLQEQFLGIPGQGRWQTFAATFTHRIANGLILETWRTADDLGRVLQLGARIEPPSAEDESPRRLDPTTAPQRAEAHVATRYADVEDEVHEASELYYAALSRLLSGDAGPLMAAWSHSADVTAMNPYGGCEVGWERLHAVFERVAQMCAGSLATVTLGHALLRISGDLAYQIGIESCDGTIAGRAVFSQHRVTNIYRREQGGWKMIHRHTDLNPAERDLPQLLD